MQIIQNRRGFGVEDTPFMILAAVAVIMLVTWMGLETMASFVEGNDYQAAVEASTGLYMRCRTLTLANAGSSDEITIDIPKGYAVSINGSLSSLAIDFENETFTNYTNLTDPLSLKGYPISATDPIVPSGRHKFRLINNGDNIEVIRD
jgi:hypothetical protein